MTDKLPAEIIIVHEKPWHSIVSDAGTFVLIFVIIGAGRWMDSEAMQWLGFFVLCLAAISRPSRWNRITPQEAADYLAERFGVRGTEPRRD